MWPMVEKWAASIDLEDKESETMKKFWDGFKGCFEFFSIPIELELIGFMCGLLAILAGIVGIGCLVEFLYHH